ncbi:MAG TPA: DNA-processing protein DprA [Burkholderiales bacterium]|nr:DNA-processing protein DprA [Burkholderiales bacterium]
MSDDALRRLLVAHGSPEAVLEAPIAALRATVAGPTAAAIKNGAPEERVEAALRWLSEPDNHLVTLADTAYPAALLQLTDPPPALYVKGRTELLARRGIAVVGSRNATPQGCATARDFARALSDAGLVITSGLALGIDTAAHEGGLEGCSSTIAIVGTGLDIVYPARNRELAHRIARDGALVSEFPLGMPALAANFPRRNRLISGMAVGCLVVEAALSSGSLITARLANEQGKDVFAIPGSIHSALSKGCHALIKQGAKLVDTADDILEELHMSAGAQKATAPAREAHPLLHAMGHDPCDLDTLATRSGLAAAEVAVLVTRFELEGRIAALPGGLYQRVH